MRRLALLTSVAGLLAVVAAVALIFVPQRAVAHITGVGGYISNGSDCDQGKDPVNIVYKGSATLSNTLTHFSDHVGWSHDDGSTLYFLEHSTTCTTQDAQKASAAVYWATRSHTRFEYGDYDDSLGYWTAGAAHVDHSCPFHVGENFNETRNYIKDQFSTGGHSTSLAWYGYTEPRMGCIQAIYPDGYWAEIAIP